MQFPFRTGFINRIDVQPSQELIQAECLYFALLQATEPGRHQKKLKRKKKWVSGLKIPQSVEVAVSMHLLSDFRLGKSGKSGRSHCRGKIVLRGNEIERETPAISECRVQTVLRNVALVRGADRLKGVGEKCLSHFVRCCETRVQVENDCLYHCCQLPQLAVPSPSTPNCRPASPAINSESSTNFETPSGLTHTSPGPLTKEGRPGYHAPKERSPSPPLAEERAGGEAFPSHESRSAAFRIYVFIFDFRDLCIFQVPICTHCCCCDNRSTANDPMPIAIAATNKIAMNHNNVRNALTPLVWNR